MIWLYLLLYVLVGFLALVGFYLFDKLDSDYAEPEHFFVIAFWPGILAVSAFFIVFAGISTVAHILAKWLRKESK